MTKHTAKKIRTGEYEYRGWAISYFYSESYNEWCWYIASTDEMLQGRSHFDPTDTLRNAKLGIDEAIQAGHAVEI